MGPCLYELASVLVRKLQGIGAKASEPDCACLCVCELVPGLVRKLQGTGAKASGPDCACVCVNWYLALWESSKELGQKSQTKLCLCESASGLMRRPDVQKNSIQSFKLALCPSDVNKKVMLTMCFSYFSVPILKETKQRVNFNCANVILTHNIWHAFSDQMVSV
jgi:hypothetical protein